MNKNYTGCRDKNGTPICFGDTIELVITPRISLFERFGFMRIREVVCVRYDGEPGFEIPFGEGRLCCNAGCESCLEICVL